YVQSALVIEDHGTGAVFGDAVANVEAFEPRSGQSHLSLGGRDRSTNLVATKWDCKTRTLQVKSGLNHSSPCSPQGSLVRRSPKARVIASLVVALVLAIDQLSKQWALTAFGEVGSTVVLPGPIDLTLLFNYSSAFGLVPVAGGFTRWGLVALNLAVATILI